MFLFFFLFFEEGGQLATSLSNVMKKKCSMNRRLFIIKLIVSMFTKVHKCICMYARTHTHVRTYVRMPGRTYAHVHMFLYLHNNLRLLLLKGEK